MTDPHEPASLSDDVQARLDEHLDAVDAVLVRYGQGRSQRLAVTDELAGQLRDMLAARCEGREPTVADAEAVLGEVEPADAFARRSVDVSVDLDASPASGYAGFADDDGPPPKTSGWAIAGLVSHAFVSLMVPTPIILFSLLLASLGQTHMSDRPQASGVSLIMLFPVVGPVFFGFVTGLLGMGFGLLAMGKIKAAPRHVGGWGLAVFDVVFLPFWCVLALASALMGVVVWSAVQFTKAFAMGSGVFVDGWGALAWAEVLWCGPIALVLGLLLTVWWTRRVVRRLGRWRDGG